MKSKEAEAYAWTESLISAVPQSTPGNLALLFITPLLPIGSLTKTLGLIWRGRSYPINDLHSSALFR